MFAPHTKRQTNNGRTDEAAYFRASQTSADYLAWRPDLFEISMKTMDTPRLDRAIVVIALGHVHRWPSGTYFGLHKQ
jgi:hypothetical protein